MKEKSKNLIADSSLDMENLYIKIRDKYKWANQEHVFTFYNNLCDEKKQKLLNDLQNIFIDDVLNIFNTAKQNIIISATPCSLLEENKKDNISNNIYEHKEYNYYPPEIIDWNMKIKEKMKEENFNKEQNNFNFSSCAIISDKETTNNFIKILWQKIAYEKIYEGKIGILILAGGDGTRFKCSSPKGCISVGPLSSKSLFEIYCERVSRLECIVDCYFNNNNYNNSNNNNNNKKSVIPIYIMTSEKNYEETYKFFESKNFFNVNKENIYFFCQPTIPCIDINGKLFLSKEYEINKNANGNGGIFEGLKNSYAFENMKKRKIEGLHIINIDNILCKVGDPVFIGYALFNNAEIALKCVKKRNENEKIGVFCIKEEIIYTKNNNDIQNNDIINNNNIHNNNIIKNNNAKNNNRKMPCIVEYSEMNDTIRNSIFTDEKNNNTKSFLFNAGNMANYFFSLKFIEYIINNNLMNNNYHLAFKCIPHIDLTNNKYVQNENICTSVNLCIPTKPNGYKLELFIFDCFQYAKFISALYVNRDEEFAPIKNYEGDEDTLYTAKKKMSLLHQKWLIKAGGIFCDNVMADLSTENNVCEISSSISYGGENLDHIFKNNNNSLLTLPYLLDNIIINDDYTSTEN